MTVDVTADGVLGDRYRLLTRRAERAWSVLWRGEDVVLSRPVAVKLITCRPAGSRRREPPGRFDRIAAAAGRAGRVTDPRLVRVLDVGFIEPETAYLVTEWVQGATLVGLLRDGPLPAPEATDVIWQVAAGLRAAHENGAGHGRLHPGNVLVTADGDVRITDLEVAAAGRGEQAPDAAGRVEGDLVALGALLYASVTGTWPRPGPAALPLAPVLDGRLAAPHQVHAGVPKPLDVLAMRLLAEGDRTERAGGRGRRIGTAARAADLLEPLPRRRVGTPAEPATRPPRVPPGLRRWAVRVGPWAALVVVAVLGWQVGLSAGRVPGAGPGLVATGTSAGAAGAHQVPVAAVRELTAGTGAQDPGGAGLAVDGNPATGWQTGSYPTAGFGGGAAGAGLLLDLGRPVAVRLVRVDLTRPGAVVQLRFAARAPVGAADTVLAATATSGTGPLLLRPPPGVRARYWVVWVARLPAAGSGRFQVGITEVTVSA